MVPGGGVPDEVCGRLRGEFPIPARCGRVPKGLAHRFGKFGLELAEDKTRLMRFGRFVRTDLAKTGEKPERFDFLGFKHVCGADPGGNFALVRVPCVESPYAVSQDVIRPSDGHPASATWGARCGKSARRVLRRGDGHKSVCLRPVPHYDKISHDWLLGHVPMDRVILQKWLNPGTWKHVLHESMDGISQGGIVSPALANCALDGLECVLQEKFPVAKRLRPLGGKKPCVHLVRYADDFVITSKSKELLEGEIKSLVEQFLQERGLELSPTKTVITHVEHGFDFLGQNVRRDPNGKLPTSFPRRMLEPS